MRVSKVLFLAADPTDDRRLHLDEEWRAIDEAIGAATYREQISLLSQWAARPGDLLQALHKHRPALLHYSGHGAGDQGLCFHAPGGGTAHVSTDGLCQAVAAAGESLQVVVLNTCFSQAQAQSLVAHVPCVIGVSSAIGDQVAIAYAASLYGALTFGRSVADAHHSGLAAVELNATDPRTRDIISSARDSGMLPRLLARPDTDAGSIYLAGPQSSLTINDSSVYEMELRIGTRQLDAEVLARVREDLCRITGDQTLLIRHAVRNTRTSVRLILYLDAKNARSLLRQKEHGGLARIAGFDLIGLFEWQAPPSAAPPARPTLGADPIVHRIARLIQRPEPRTEFADWLESPHLELRLVEAFPWDIRPPGTPVESPIPGPAITTQPGDSDRDLMSYLQQGELQIVLMRLMQRHGTAVYRYCWEMLRDRSLAEQCLQQTFISVYRKLTEFSGLFTFRTWIFATARRHVFALRGRQPGPGRDSAVIAVPAPRNHGPRIDDAQLRDALNACLCEMGDHVRDALLLRFQQGFSFEEMAAICLEKPGTLQARVMRALPKLRTCIEQRTSGTV